MGSIPNNCGEEFEVSSSGPTKEKAKQNAQNKANDLCKRMNQGCNDAHEVGEGSYKEQPDLVTYTSTYVCMEV